MATPPRKPVPGRRPPPDQNRARALAVAGLVGLFLILIVIVVMISGGGDDEGEKTASEPKATATATPKPTRTPKPKPTAVPLTPDEKLDRQDDIDIVRSRGFDVVKKTDWKPKDTLQVLIGRSSSGGELAFFFVDGQYLGNDSSDASSRLRVKSTDDVSVTLRYGIYEPGDTAAKPSDDFDIDFRYEGGRVQPSSAIPAVSQRTASG